MRENKVKLGENFQQQAEREDEKRLEIHQPVGLESHQSEKFVVDSEEIVPRVGGGETFDDFLHVDAA